MRKMLMVFAAFACIPMSVFAQNTSLLDEINAITKNCKGMQCDHYKAEANKFIAQLTEIKCLSNGSLSTSCDQIKLSSITQQYQKRVSDLFGTISFRESRKNATVQAAGPSGLESLAATDVALIFNASGNIQDGWSDLTVKPNGQMALNEEILKNFCNPKCPQGKVKIGVSFTADLLNKPQEVVLKELQALVTGAKANGFYFLIHANHEWVFTPNLNPFGGTNADWAEYTNWNTPLEKFYVAWSEIPPEIGLKPNFHSPLVRKKVRSDIEVISKFVSEKILTDSEAHKLFLGIDVGWETEVTPWVTPQNKTGPLGFAALAAKGFSASNPPKDFQQELGNIVREYSDFVVQTYEGNGVLKKYLFSHIVAINKPDIEKRNPLDVAKLLDINLGTSAFGVEFDIPRIYNNMTKNWAIVETDPGGALNYARNLPANPPRFIIAYSWGDNIRNNQKLLSSFNDLLNTTEKKIYRLYGQRDGTHLFSFAPDEGERDVGYQRNGHAFNLAISPSLEATIPLYRCILHKNGDQVGDRMLSLDSKCEGYKTESLLGYMMGSATGNKRCQADGICYESKPLFRCYNQAAGKHLSTVNQEECTKNNYKVEGIGGYVWAP